MHTPTKGRSSPRPCPARRQSWRAHRGELADHRGRQEGDDMTDDNTTDQTEPKKETAAEIYASRGRKPIRGAAIDDRPPTEVTHTSNWSTGATALIGVA